MVFNKFQRGDITEKYNSLTKEEKEELKEYLQYRKARGLISEDKLTDVSRLITQIRLNLSSKYDDLTLKQLRNLVADINTSNYSEPHKNDLKANLKNFLKWKFKDWSLRFDNLSDIHLKARTMNEKKLNASTMLKKEDIEQLVKHENRTYWKAFLLVQYEAGLRTKEVRFLKWDNLELNEEGDISSLQVYATKTHKARPLFVKLATPYLAKLKEEQENLKQSRTYIFASPQDKNKPVSQSAVSQWIKELTKKTFGTKKVCWNYLLRHSRATELYRLAREGKVSKDIVQDFMGHSQDMSAVYTHLDEKEIKKMMKEQIYNLEEVSPEKKSEYERKFEEQDRRIKKLEEMNKDLAKRNELALLLKKDLDKRVEVAIKKYLKK